MTHAVDSMILLRAGGVALLLDCTAGQLPAVVHWGADLGGLSASDSTAMVTAGMHPIVPNIVDEPVRVALLPEHRTGWVGRPGLSGSRAGRDWSPWFVGSALFVGGNAVTEPGLTAVDAGVVEWQGADAVAGSGRGRPSISSTTSEPIALAKAGTLVGFRRPVADRAGNRMMVSGG